MPHCFNAHPGLGRSVGLFGLLVNPANLLEQHTVLLAALGLFTSGRCVVSCGATPVRLTRHFSCGWRRLPGSQRQPEKISPAWTANGRTKGRMMTGPIRTIPMHALPR